MGFFSLNLVGFEFKENNKLFPIVVLDDCER